MPFGKYGAKTVQSMEGLFNAHTVNRGFAQLGSYGKKGAAVAERGVKGEMIALGRKRAAYGAGGVAVLGAIGASRSSGRNGLQTRSSAPPPNPYGY